MSEYHDLVAALTWLVVQKLQHQGRYVRGLLGDGQGHVQVPERPDYSYVRPDRYTTRKFEVFNKLVDGYDGMPVVLGELPWQPGLTQVLAVDWDTYEGVGWGETWSGVKRHGAGHEWRDGAPGYDTFNVYRRQFGDLKTYPVGSGSTSVYVSAYNFTHLESLKTWPGYPGLSLAGAVPSTTGTARMALVYWDPASGSAGALGVATGTLGADAGPELLNWPYAPAGTIPSAWVKLRGGQGLVSEFDIWDARQPWTPTLEFATGSAGIWSGLIPIADAGGFFTGSTVEQALQELGGSGGGPPSGPAGGDLTGSYPNPVVDGLLGRPLGLNPPAEGYVLMWTGSAWQPHPLTAQPPTGPAGGDLTGTYPNPNLGAIWGYPVQSGAPAQGDIWMFSGTGWRHVPLDLYGLSFVTAEDESPTLPNSRLIGQEVNTGLAFVNPPGGTMYYRLSFGNLPVTAATVVDGDYIAFYDSSEGNTESISRGDFLGTPTAKIDLDGNADALVLDANADTSISAPTDNQIDFEAGNADRMTLTAAGLAMATGARIDEFSTDGTLGGNSDTALPTEKAVKTYCDRVYTDWTPTITQSGNVTVTVSEAKYALDGKTCHVQARLIVTGSGTGGNSIVVGNQPAAMQPAVANSLPIGVGSVVDAGVATYPGILVPITATDWRIIDAGTRNYVGLNPNVALGASDEILFSATYRVA